MPPAVTSDISFFIVGEVDDAVLQEPGFVLLLGPLLADRDIAVGDDLVDRRRRQAGNARDQRARGLVDVEPARGSMGDALTARLSISFGR